MTEEEKAEKTVKEEAKAEKAVKEETKTEEVKTVKEEKPAEAEEKKEEEKAEKAVKEETKKEEAPAEKIEEPKKEETPAEEVAKEPKEEGKIDIKKIEAELKEEMLARAAKKTRKPREVKKPREDVTKEEVTGENTLVPLDDYLKAGIHIGSQYKTGDMRGYIYKTRQDGLHVLDIKTIDKRMKLATEFLSGYEPAKILVVAGRVYARKPARKFAESIGCLLSVRRFVPGTLTNPNNPNFVEPDVIIVSDPGVDKQVIKEAQTVRIPVVAFCDTNNHLKNVDVALPLNNKGKKSLALAYWLLTREILLKRGTIKSPSDFTTTIEDFESTGKA